MPRQPASVNARDPGIAFRTRNSSSDPVGTPGRGPCDEVPHDDATAPWPPGLVVSRVHAVAAYVRIGERDDLAGVTRVGYDLLVAAQHCVEDKFPTGYAVRRRRPDGLALKNLPVGKRQEREGTSAPRAAPELGTARPRSGRASHCWAPAPAVNAGSSALSNRPDSVRAAGGVLRLASRHQDLDSYRLPRLIRSARVSRRGPAHDSGSVSVRNSDPPGPTIRLRCQIGVVHTHSCQPHVRCFKSVHGEVALDGRVLELFHKHDPFNGLGAIPVQVVLGEIGGTSSIDKIVEQYDVALRQHPVVGRQVSYQVRGTPLVLEP